jgi:purine-nucleoside phosphorylase
MENNKEANLEDQINTAVSFIREKTDKVCDVLIVLGSGLGPLADLVENPVLIPYGTIPGFAASSVHGHKGQFVIGDLQGVSVIVMQGRVHFYEGLPVRQITLPIRVAKVLGASVMIITNAAGGVNPSFEVGDLMLITDHINFLGMAGQNPLIGSNNDNLGPRFPQMTDAYTPSLQQLSRTVSEKTGIALRSGVLFSQSGPAYETPAEVKFLRIVGADAVGMSVANEVLVARHSGMTVVGFSSITNVARLSLEEGEPPSHQEVIDAANVVGPKLVALIRGVLEALPLKK